MSLDDLVAGSYGATVEITVQEDGAAADISSFTGRTVKLQAPDGTEISKPADFKTDGTDGVITFTFASGDLDADLPGEWTLEPTLSAAGVSIICGSRAFHVAKAI